MNELRATTCTPRRRKRVAAMVATLVGVGLSGSLVAGGLTRAAEEEGYGSNLSVPAIFLPDTDAAGAPALRGGECAQYVAPTGPRSIDYPGYYLQKTEAVWQAECAEMPSLDVTANWGDNLTSRPVVSTRQPIRVEVGLEYSPASAMTGFVVDNLTPDLDDRVATYGTRGDAVDFTKVRVFDSGATLRIERLDGPGGVIFEGPMSAEVNSVGAVVYGYNWGVKGKTNRALPGSYRITFTANNATIAGVDAGDAGKATFTETSTSVVISVSGSPGLKGGANGGGSGSGGSGGQGPGGPGGDSGHDGRG